ncbi:MAG: hypothetical protein K2X45_13410 [Phreatobacter sp.]|jgi:hypothetical protein|nr:hypothetical protein [Phreatobacter sp.]
MTTLSSIGSQTLTQSEDNAMLDTDPRRALVGDAADSSFTMEFEYDDSRSWDGNMDRIDALTRRGYVTEFPGPGEFIPTPLDAIDPDDPRHSVTVLVKATYTGANPVFESKHNLLSIPPVVFYTIETCGSSLDYGGTAELSSWNTAPDFIRLDRNIRSNWSYEIMWDWKGPKISQGYSDFIEEVGNELFEVASRLIGNGFERDLRTGHFLFQAGIAHNSAMHLVCDALEIAANIDLLAARADGRRYERPSTRPSFPSAHLQGNDPTVASYDEVQNKIYESARFYGRLMSSLPKEVIDVRAADCAREMIQVMFDMLYTKIDGPKWLEDRSPFGPAVSPNFKQGW